MGRLVNLTELYINGNRVRCLPSSFSLLTSLRTLDLSHNELTSLAGADDLADRWGVGDPTLQDSSPLSALSNLQSLLLHHNGLRRIPRSLSKLKSLYRLSLSNNQLTSLPAWLTTLPTLKRPSIGSNPLTVDLQTPLLTRTLPSLKELVALRLLRSLRSPTDVDIFRTSVALPRRAD
jgi:leucine-rich repeat protein SHOC2